MRKEYDFSKGVRGKYAGKITGRVVRIKALAEEQGRLEFDQVIRRYRSKRKTNEWIVLNGNRIVGLVLWRGGRYVFAPMASTYLNALHLMDISEFCWNQTVAHKKEQT